MRLSVAEIVEAADGELLVSNQSSEHCADVVVTGVNWDSRVIEPGNMYVALPGERVDGHDFVDAAARAGAVCALVSHKVETTIPIILVDDTAQALTRVSAYWRSQLGGVVIGLTGSVGKTSTKNLVRDVLSHAYAVVATLANQNNELGVPNTLLAADADTDVVVVEMGMRGSGQIAELCGFTRPDWGIVTNVGESHIELLGSRDNIARAKAELFEALPDGSGIAFVNAADDYADEMFEFANLDGRDVTAVLYGGSPNRGVDGIEGSFQDARPHVWADGVSFDEEGRPRFKLRARNVPVRGVVSAIGETPAGRNASQASSLSGEIEVKLELRGAHNVTNACAAAAVGLVAGMTLEQVRDALAAAQPEQGRQQVTRTDEGITVFDDSYNASPDSMRASLNTFSSMAVAGKRIAVLGDMLELGDFAQECHERVGVMAANARVDRLICVGELSRSMARAARDAGLDPRVISTCDDASEALAMLEGILEPGDAVLAKASHSIGLDQVVKGLVG